MMRKPLKNKIKCFDIKVLFYTTLYKSYMTPPFPCKMHSYSIVL